MTEIAERELNRLRWQCRRGMLELDELLLGFLEAGYADLEPAQRDTFRRLLSVQDQVLHGWFFRDATPDDAALLALVRHILTVVGGAAR